MLNDYGKLILLMTALVSAVVLMALGHLSDTAGVGVIMAIVGYVTGNGRLAVRGEQGSQLLTSKRQQDGSGLSARSDSVEG